MLLQELWPFSRRTVLIFLPFCGTVPQFYPAGGSSVFLSASLDTICSCSGTDNKSLGARWEEGALRRHQNILITIYLRHGRHHTPFACGVFRGRCTLVGLGLPKATLWLMGSVTLVTEKLSHSDMVRGNKIHNRVVSRLITLILRARNVGQGLPSLMN